METTDASSQKSIVEQLNFGSKTAKRMTWEAWEFTVVGPYQIEVTNASYGYLKDDHSYVVMVKEEAENPIPNKCECPADEYQEDYDCKHKVALAAVGGLPVLNAAVNYETPTEQPAANKLRTDGGCECLKSDFPCFECYRIGRRDLPK
jgi:hypothetical protein